MPISEAHSRAPSFRLAKNCLQIIDGTLEALTPERYVRNTLGIEPFDWQIEAVRPDPPTPSDRLLLLAARQSGKSYIVAAEAQHTAKSYYDALNLVICPAKDQSAEVMQKVTVGIARDAALFDSLTRDGVTLKEFSNMSRIVALPGTERSVRGYSAPRTIILDEAARILDETYMAVRPMMTAADTNLVAMTTAFGKRGWFYRAWTESKRWRKILVRVPWDPVNGRLVDALPLDEFKDYWAERGVSAYYSPRHLKWQLEEDLEEMGDIWFRQEYCCDFIDEGGALFTYDDIMAAFNYDARQYRDDQASAIVELLEEEQELEAVSSEIAPLEV